MGDNLFGMGILITVSDKATSALVGISKAVENTESAFRGLGNDSKASIDKLEKSLDQTLLTGYALKDMGNTVSGLSQAMISPLVNLTKEVINTSSQFEDWRVTLKALYKDADVAKEKLNWGMNLAASTPFDVGTITQAMIGFKAMGVEVDTMFKNSNGHMRSFLEYVGDLGALRPDVGLEGVMLGIRNLVGGDGGKSLKMRLDMDLESILGRSFGDTPEQIMKDIVEVSDKIAGGLMMELEGTWSQILSNMEDQLTRFTLAIGDGGAFEMAKQAILPFYEVIQSIDDNKLAKIGKNLADGLGLVLVPLKWVVKGLSMMFKGLVEVVSQNSLLSKFVVTFLAVGGGLTALLGVFLSTCGGLLTTIATLGLFAIQIVQNGTLIARIFTGIKLGLASALTFALKFLAIAGLISLAWKTNFLKIRTTITQFVSDIKFAFDKSKEVASYSANEMMRVLNNLGQRDFTGKLTYRLTQLRVFFGALVENWNSGTLSPDTFQKVDKLGLTPLVSKLNGYVNTVRDAFSKSKELAGYNASEMLRVLKNLDTDNVFGRLTYRLTQARVLFGAFVEYWNKGELSPDTINKLEVLGLAPLVKTLITAKEACEEFINGFKEGFKEGLVKVQEFVKGVIEAFKPYFDNFNLVLKSLGMKEIKFGEKLDLSSVESFGKALGELAPALALCWGAFKLFNGVVKVASTVLKPIGWMLFQVKKFLGPLAKDILPLVVSGFGKFGKAVFGAGKYLLGLALANPHLALLVGAIMAVVGAGILLYKNWDTVKEKWGQAMDFIKTKGDECWNGLLDWLSTIINAVIDWGASVGDIIANCVNWICDKTEQFKTWVSEKWNQMINAIVDYCIQLYNDVSTWWSNLVNSVVDYCTNLYNNVTTWWSNIKTTISQKVQEAWNNVCNWFSNIVTSVSNYCSKAWNTVSTWWTNIKTTITNKIREAWNNACTWFTNIVNSARTILSKAKSTVENAMNNVKDGIKNALSKAWDTATEWWNKIKDIFKNPIKATVNFIETGFNSILKKKKKVDGSEFNGISFVPKDGYLAELHRGERVLTAQENKQYNKAKGLMNNPSSQSNVYNNQQDNSKVFKPVTNNNTTTSTVTNDNSVTFSEGAIVLNVAQATKEEAERLAKIIMDKIQKEQQLRSRLNYGVR